MRHAAEAARGSTRGQQKTWLFRPFFPLVQSLVRADQRPLPKRGCPRAAYTHALDGRVRRGGGAGDHHVPADARRLPSRSEEHTSELQSLMRISYAVFCLKKKKK